MNSPDVLIETPIGTEYHLNNGLPADGVVTEMSDKTLEVWSSKPGQPSPAIQRLTARINGLNKPIDQMKLCSERLAEAKNEVPSSAVQIPPTAEAAARDYTEKWRLLDQVIIKQHRSKIGQPEAASAKPAQTFQGEQVWQGSDQPNYEAKLRQHLEGPITEGPITEGPTSGIHNRILKELAAEEAPAHVRSSIVGNPLKQQEPELPFEGQPAYLVNITDKVAGEGSKKTPVLSDSSVDPEYGLSPRTASQELFDQKVAAAAAIEEIGWLCNMITEISDLLSNRVGIIVKLSDKESVLGDFRRRLVQTGAKDSSGELVTINTPLSIISTDTVLKIKKDLLKLLKLLEKRIITGDTYDEILEMTRMKEVKRILGEIEDPED